MLPDRVSNPGPLTYESGALMIALCGPVFFSDISTELNVEGKRYEKREYRYMIRKPTISTNKTCSKRKYIFE